MGIFGDPKALSEVRDDLARIRGDVKQLRLEWDDMAEKLAKMVRRYAQERARLEAAEEQTKPPDGEVATTTDTPLGGFLTDNQRKIQQQVLRRRAYGHQVKQ